MNQPAASNSRQSSIGNRQSAIGNFSAFSMVELLVTMTLLSLIVLALMAVFNSTQKAFRASVTQTDILEGSRAAAEMIASDLRTMVPSYGTSNLVNGSVNFFSADNASANNFSYSGLTLLYHPLQQSLPGSATLRANVLNYFFVLGRNNQKWTGVGYVVNATNTSPLYPLYRFYGETNAANPPYSLYSAFLFTINQGQWTNMSHVLDGVVHLAVRPYDLNGCPMTNTFQYHGPTWSTNRNVAFYAPVQAFGEVGCYFYSNAVPASIELQLGVLEDRTLQRAESFGTALSQSNYLAQQSGHVYLFHQRVTIPNVDPSAYQ